MSLKFFHYCNQCVPEAVRSERLPCEVVFVSRELKASFEQDNEFVSQDLSDPSYFIKDVQTRKPVLILRTGSISKPQSNRECARP